MKPTKRKKRDYMMYLQGEAAVVMRKASIALRSRIWPERVNLNQACQMIAEFYLQHHSAKKLPKRIQEIMMDSKRIA